jgi:hypothetical protein
MRQRVFAAAGFVFVLLMVGSVSPAFAQATRTWVSGVGDDVNPCSRTAPCKTFAGAISKTSADGFINVIDPGSFGAITITKSITIDGDGAHAGVLGSVGNAMIINGAGIRVTIRNLSLDSDFTTSPGTNGINVLNAAEVHVENVTINGFTNEAIHFAPSGAGAEGYFSHVTMINNAGGGLVVTNGRVVADNLHSQSNGNGVMVNGNAIATVRNSFAGGGGAGFGASTAVATINVENCVSTHNQFGIFVYGGAAARVSNSFITDNVTWGLKNDGISFVISLGGNTLYANPNQGVFQATIPKQ